MAITQNTYTGDGTSVLFSFSFPYLANTDIKVSLDGVTTTAYTLANATTIEFNTAPANGVAIRIYRETDIESTKAIFYPGAAIRAQDLNDDFDQVLYASQESNREAADAVTKADAAVTTSNTAATDAATAISTANTAVTTANTAVTTANTALATANTANTNASAAVTTANQANATATAVLNATSELLTYTIIANVAAIPSSPADGDAVRIIDSTGIESFTPLSGLPGGFTGNTALTVEIYYNSTSTTWVWVRYYANDPENRYALESDMTQAQSDVSTLYSDKLDVTTAAATYQTLAGMSNYVATADIGVTVEAYDATILKSADIGVSVQGYDATTLKGADIGVSVQGYDADTAKLDVVQTFTAVQTLTYPAIVGTILEDVYTITDAAAFEVDPGNGSVQLITLGDNRTPKATNFAAGESVTLMVDDGTAYTLTWTDATWGTSGVVWTGGSAPTLATTGYSVIQFWKVGSQVYGAYVGEVA